MNKVLALSDVSTIGFGRSRILRHPNLLVMNSVVLLVVGPAQTVTEEIRSCKVQRSITDTIHDYNQPIWQMLFQFSSRVFGRGG